jgi:hypothetical protein
MYGSDGGLSVNPERLDDEFRGTKPMEFRSQTDGQRAEHPRAASRSTLSYPLLFADHAANLSFNGSLRGPFHGPLGGNQLHALQAAKLNAAPGELDLNPSP